jgi:rhamnosyltransferase
MQVAVLLSAYNGETFLREQIESIVAQHGVEVRLLVRDDGSTDGTPALLQDLQQAHGFRLISGPNLGVIGSFFALVAAAPDDADLYAFADQDDWWQPDKLARAAARLQASGAPTDSAQLYCSAYTISDEALRPQRTVVFPGIRPGFGNALVENIAPGCTMVFNAQARNLLCRSIPDARPLMHDWWLYQLVSGLGTVRYDTESHILYRQHGRNVVGTSASRLKHLWRRIQRFLRYEGINHLRRQALEFQRWYGDDLPEPNRSVLAGFLAERTSPWRRLRYALDTPTYRQRRFDNVVLRILIALGRI